MVREVGTSGRRALYWKMIDSGEHIASISCEADLSDPENAWMRLHYKRDGTPEDYKVRLTTTRPNYGGRRWWFVCPAGGCRTAKLYLAAGGDWFVCRQAYGMAYRSQNEGPEDRQASRVHQFRRKLGGEAGFDQPMPPKPKGMHWSTYNRMCDEITFRERSSWAGAAKRFGIDY